MLEVGVHEDRGRPARKIEPREQRVLLAEIARQLNHAQRIALHVARGNLGRAIIKTSAVKPQHRAVEAPVRGLTMIEIEGHVTERVIRALGGLAEVSAIHTTNGRWDLVVELATGTLTDLDAVLARIRRIPGIANSETSLLLATPRSTRAKL